MRLQKDRPRPIRGSEQSGLKGIGFFFHSPTSFGTNRFIAATYDPPA
jgi:hypothetical protein